MKKLLFICVVLAVMSCKTEDKKIQQIEKSIADAAMNNDIGYSKGELSEVKTYSITALFQLFKDQTKEDFKTPSDAYEAYKGYVEDFKNADDINNYWIAKGRMDLFANLKDKNVEETAYKIYRYDYRINNLMSQEKNDKVSVANYYIFNGKDSLITKTDDFELKELKKELIQYPEYAYLVVLTKHFGQP